MCERGSWRGFHTRYITDSLAVIEQCGSCGSYRAREIEHLPYVRDTEEDATVSDDGFENIPDPSDGDDESPWMG